jgi:hypothetical protein
MKILKVIYLISKALAWLIVASLCFVGIESIIHYNRQTFQKSIFDFSIIDNELAMFIFLYIMASLWYYANIWQKIDNKTYKYSSLILCYPIVLLVTYWVPGVLLLLFTLSANQDSI